MGCDYYILKLLQIYYNNDDFLEIELYRQKGYYIDDDQDEDEDYDDYSERFHEYVEYCLETKMKPIVIYNNNCFCKSSFDTKYTNIIEDEIVKHNKTWSEITKIVKVEKRLER
uniref:Uncharacterized protein n=1 Tax=viral metagenome TaxID=1070528 RepID=A0A6C0H3I1_9ZZZZ